MFNLWKKKLIIVDDLDLINEQCQQVFRTILININKYSFYISMFNVHKVIESLGVTFTYIKNGIS